MRATATPASPLISAICSGLAGVFTHHLALIPAFALLYTLSAHAQDAPPIERIDRIQTNPPLVAEGQGFELFIVGNGAWTVDGAELRIDEDAQTITVDGFLGLCGTPVGQFNFPNQASIAIPPLESGVYSVDISLDVPWGCRRVTFRGELDVLSHDRPQLMPSELSYRGGPPQLVGSHESPAAGETVSGIGLLRGWACYDTKRSWPWVGNVSFQINDGDMIKAAQGTSRLDTSAQCGEQASRSGYGLVINWNLLGVGEHTIKVYVDGILFDDLTFNVAGFGQEFLQDASAEYLLEGFPNPGEQTTIGWSKANQGFVVTDYLIQE